MKSKLNTFTGHIAEEDQPHTIPDSWLWIEIGALSEVVAGGTPSTTKGSYFDGGSIPWVTPADMSGFTEMYLSEGRRNITEDGLQKSSARLLPTDSLLFSSRAPIGYVAIAKNPISTNQGFKSFLPSQAYLPHYGYWYLKSIKSLAESMASGTTFLELSGSKAAKIPFPLAPIEEQRRIAAQLDAAMQRIATSQARLEKLPVLLKKFRQAVLAAAVSGKLTEAWRVEQPQSETAELFLKRVRKELREQWEENQLAKMKGKHLLLNDSWKQKYEEPAAPDTTDAPEIPIGWVYATFEQISERVTVGFVGSMKNEYVEEGIPFLRSQNVRENRFSPDGLMYISPEFHDAIRKSTLEPGDLVVVRSGSVGTACVIPDSLVEANCSDLVIVKQPKVLPDFCGYFMNSAAKSQVSSQTVGIALSHFNTKAMAKMPLPVPPYEEQLEIVRQVKHYFDLADQVETRFEQAAAMVEQLPQALLAKAFSGQLVPQDPNDEPASAILERLQTSAVAPAKGQRGRKPTMVSTAPLFG